MSNHKNLEHPYYAVIFTSILEADHDGYEEMSNHMIALVKEQKGFLGFESARQSIGITISYWDSLESIASWKKNEEHLVAQHLGISKWYSYYQIRICKVEREYEFKKSDRN
jgi:heme-degrading monooxygenase HmoA